MKRLHALNGGRLRVWWFTHRQEAKNAACLTAIIAAFLLVSHFDHEDVLNTERAAREAVTEELRQERAARELPRVTFVIEAKTPAEASAKLADIAGDLDGWRARNRVR